MPLQTRLIEHNVERTGESRGSPRPACPRLGECERLRCPRAAPAAAAAGRAAAEALIADSVPCEIRLRAVL